MNFLAHLFLSGNNSDVMIGNFIADHVRGKKYGTYNNNIIKGVEMHRFIDHFTDNHPVVLESKIRLRPHYHKYAPVIVDIFYDHFLAANWNAFSTIPLDEFSRKVYTLMNHNFNLLPQKTQKMLPYMIRHNWLVSYSSIEGAGKMLAGMSRRAKFQSHMETSVDDLRKDYFIYKNEFEIFFPELIKATEGFQ